MGGCSAAAATSSDRALGTSLRWVPLAPCPASEKVNPSHSSLSFKTATKGKNPSSQLWPLTCQPRGSNTSNLSFRWEQPEPP